jgi:enolase-phosphatase E1
VIERTVIPENVRGILLDIEGTTSSISYVYEVLFPFAREHLDTFLREQWEAPGTLRALNQLARDAGAASFIDWTSDDSLAQARERVRSEVQRLMADDVKSTGLKELQGLIWRGGFESGQLRAHVFPDVPAALEWWAVRRLDARIYSSGSVAAQQLFFAHTEVGDLSALLHGYYDTTTGPKREPASYRRIAEDMQLLPASILFLSDVVPELDAARAAGIETRLVVRPGNARSPEGHVHAVIRSFDELR